MDRQKVIESLYSRLLSEKTKEKSEKAIVVISIISFLVHLGLIVIAEIGLINPQDYVNLFHDPIQAIYTPFTFILFYEVYLLIYYLSYSITIYIGKQYEIITLIVIRRIFKDISNLELTTEWFSVPYNQQFTFDVITTVVLFFLTYLFYWLNFKRAQRLRYDDEITPKLSRFITTKKAIAVLLVPVFVVLATYSIGDWIYSHLLSLGEMVGTLRDINRVFFDDFFTILILTDVFLLLFSFIHIRNFSSVIRNSGFIISTILMKLSFNAEGLLNSGLTIVGVLFGVVILLINNYYERINIPGNN